MSPAIRKIVDRSPSYQKYLLKIRKDLLAAVISPLSSSVKTWARCMFTPFAAAILFVLLCTVFLRVKARNKFAFVTKIRKGSEGAIHRIKFALPFISEREISGNIDSRAR